MLNTWSGILFTVRKRGRKWQNKYNLILTWNEIRRKLHFQNIINYLAAILQHPSPFCDFWNCQHGVKTMVISVMFLLSCDAENASSIFLCCFQTPSLEKLMVCCNSVMNWAESPHFPNSQGWVTFFSFPQQMVILESQEDAQRVY